MRFHETRIDPGRGTARRNRLIECAGLGQAVAQIGLDRRIVQIHGGGPGKFLRPGSMVAHGGVYRAQDALDRRGIVVAQLWLQDCDQLCFRFRKTACLRVLQRGLKLGLDIHQPEPGLFSEPERIGRIRAEDRHFMGEKV